MPAGFPKHRDRERDRLDVFQLLGADLADLASVRAVGPEVLPLDRENCLGHAKLSLII